MEFIKRTLGWLLFLLFAAAFFFNSDVHDFVVTAPSAGYVDAFIIWLGIDPGKLGAAICVAIVIWINARKSKE